MGKHRNFLSKIPKVMLSASICRVFHPTLGRYCCNSIGVTLLQQWSLIGTIALDTTVASAAFVIPLVALLSPSPGMWRK